MSYKQSNKGYMDIREKLKKGNVEFYVKGITDYRRGDDGEYGYHPQIFKVHLDGESINSGYRSMNVNKWGPTCVTLYTFDMLGKKSVGKINYKNVILK